MAVFGKWGYRGPYRKGEIRIKYTKFLMAMEIAGVIMLLSIFIYTAYRFSALPEQVPVHYGADGSADSWGNKTHLWFVPVTALLLHLLITIAGFFPNTWNYPGKIKADKLPKAENLMRNMIMWVKIIILAIFGYMQYKILSLSNNVSMVVTFGLTGVMFAIIIYYIIKVRRLCK